MSWAISTSGMIDGPYTGSYATREEAVAAAAQFLTDAECDARRPFHVAQARPPKVDFSGRDFVEMLAFDCEGDFGGESAEDWPAFSASEEQQADLTRAIEAAFVAWLERHGMVPDWRVVENPERLTLGAAREMVAKQIS